MKSNKRAEGNTGETIAVDFLQKKGYSILERNFRYERGEIDIIADDKGALVFIEVKARRSAAFGEPLEAVTERKRAQIRKVADGYLFLHNIDDRECRFDVVAIRYIGKKIDIQHFENAF
ncbi:MAG: YraN family protein [Bacteroidota bacterium]